MATERVLKQSDGSLDRLPRNDLNIFQYAWKFTKGLMKDHNFWTRTGGAWYGGVLIAQGIAVGLCLLSLPILVQPLAAVACCALVGAGLYGVRYGFSGAWNSLEDLCTKTFRTFNPLKAIRTRTLRPAKRISENPLIKKIANRRILRFKRHRTQEQRDVFLAGLTIEGAVAEIAVCALGVAAFVAGLPAITAGSMLTLGMGVAAFVVTTAAFDFYCSVKSLGQAYRARKEAKQAFEKEHPPCATADMTNLLKSDTVPAANAAPVFNKEAWREQLKKDVVSHPRFADGQKSPHRLLPKGVF